MISVKLLDEHRAVKDVVGPAFGKQKLQSWGKKVSESLECALPTVVWWSIHVSAQNTHVDKGGKHFPDFFQCDNQRFQVDHKRKALLKSHFQFKVLQFSRDSPNMEDLPTDVHHSCQEMLCSTVSSTHTNNVRSTLRTNKSTRQTCSHKESQHPCISVFEVVITW